MCFILLVAGGQAGCSGDSSSGKGNNGGGGASTAGNGTIITGGSSGAGTGGSRTGGTGGTAGTGATDCANTPVVCVDAQTAKACNPDTMMDETITCEEDAKELGIVSSGCQGDATEGTCSIDGYADQACGDAFQGFAVCAQVPAEDTLNVYIACYLNTEGLHDVIACYRDYVDVAAKTVDCPAAEAACLPGEGGAGNTPDPAGGAGGEPG